MVTEYESQDLVTKHELVNKRDSRTSPAWDLTAYGWIVCATIFDHDDDLDWLYRYAIGPEEITLEERVKISNCLEQLNYV